ncbi:MAG TPA: PKD domain-containing protein, partial [Bacteroidia bacterium]|nr:PKD domain-containing protein [Bacteroidia bacterium]
NDKTGPQDITLTADYNGCLSTVTKPALITVKGPIAHFDFHRTCDKKFEVDLTNKTGDATKLHWELGDGAVVDTTNALPLITHQYAATGDYKVLLVASNSTSGCADSRDSAIIHIRDVKAKFTSNQLLCKGAEYNFDASASVDVYPHCYRGYTWEFSDIDKRPINNTDPNTPIVFTKHGPQTVTLIVEDINGCKDTASTFIKVYEINPSFTMSSSSICLPATVNFDPVATTADTAIVSWYWEFGDGKTASLPGAGPGNTSNNYTTLLNPNDIAVFPFLVITDSLGCKDTLQKKIDIYKPVSKITVLPKTDICLGTQITVKGDDYTTHGSSLNFDWTMGDGIGVKNNQNNFTYTYQSSGSFLITLKFTEISSGCNGNLTQTVNVQDYPKASFSSVPSNQTVLCAPSVLSFSSNSTSTSPIVFYEWDFGNGVKPHGSTASYAYEKGTYPVKLTVSTSFGCADDTTLIYNVVGPEAKFTYVPNTPVCRGEPITFTITDTVDVGAYTWNFGDGVTVKDVSPIKHTYSYVPVSGKFPVKLILSDKKGQCPGTADGEIVLQDVRAEFNISNISNVLDTTICLGENAVLDNSGSIGGSGFIWDFGDNTPTSTVTPVVSHNYNIPGDYKITLIATSASLGCADTISKKVSILPLPVVTTVGDTVCPGFDAHISALPVNAGFTYLWAPKGDLNDSTIYNPTVIQPKVGSSFYKVYVTDLNGCTGNDSAQVYVVPPIDDISFDTTIVIGDVVHLPIDNKGGTIHFTWTPTDGLSCLKCSYPSVQPLKDITY